MSAALHRRRILSWSPHDDNRFLVLGSDLQLFEVADEESSASHFKPIDSIPDHSNQMKCVGWSLDPSEPQLVGVGSSTGKLSLMRFMSQHRVVAEFAPKYQRACTSVAFNPHSTSQVAVGLEKVRNDHCTLIYDITQGHSNGITPTASTPASDGGSTLLKLSNNEAVSSLEWLASFPFTLVVGTSLKWLRLYDTRSAGSTQPVSVIAHTKAVNSVCVDPFYGWRLASASDDGIVKLWDVRMLSSGAYQTIDTKCKSIQQISWCPTRRGLLSVMGKGDSAVSLLDIAAPLQLDVNQIGSAQSNELLGRYTSLHAIHTSAGTITPSSVSDMSLPRPHLSFDKTGASANQIKTTDALNSVPVAFSDTVVSAPSQRSCGVHVPLSAFAWHVHDEQRLLICAQAPAATSGGAVSDASLLHDVTLHDPIAISWSANNGLSFASNLKLYSSLANVPPELNQDISVLMRLRALDGYAFSLEKNEQIANAHADSRFDVTKLSAFWRHFQHAKRLAESEFAWTSGTGAQKAQSAATSASVVSTPFPGVIGLLRHSTSSTIQQSAVGPSNRTPRLLASFSVHSSAARSRALRLCGWWQLPSSDAEYEQLETLLSSMEAKGEHARAAALALFYLDLDRAVLALTRAAAHGSANATEASNYSLVAMAVAGFPDRGNVPVDDSVRRLWNRTCESVRPMITHPYLRAAFAFLAADAQGANDSSLQRYEDVMNSGMDLVDRVAFALRFLPDSELLPLLDRWSTAAATVGDLGGCVLTGLSTTAGFDLLASYVDRTADVQLPAIVTAFLNPFNILGARDQSCAQKADRWLQAYRSLLDAWQLWTMRAKFDTARAIVVSQWVLGGQGGTTNAPTSNARGAQILQPIASQVFARCQYCSTALSLPRLLDPARSGTGSASSSAASRGTLGSRAGGLAASRLGGLGLGARSDSEPAASAPQVTLSASKSRLTACPTCKRPLPHCALCLLPFTVAPPTLNTSSKRDTVVVDVEEAAFDRSSPQGFDQWFTWCQSCRHGGHSVHMREWFQTHDDCPVTDCNCRCAKYVVPDVK